MERRIAAGPKSDIHARKHFIQDTDLINEETLSQYTTGSLTTAQAISKYKLTSKLEVNGPITISKTVNTEAQLKCVKWMEEFDYIATGNVQGEVTLYNSENMEVLKTLKDTADLANAAVTSIKHRPVSKDHPIANNIICTYSNGFVKSWNYNYNECLFSIKETRETNGLAYHIRLPKFVTFGNDARIFLYDEETRTRERVFAPSEKSGVNDGHEGSVHAACFNPRSNNELLTGGADGYVLYWDVRQSNAVKCLTGVNILGEGLDINLKGIEILTCSMQKDNPLQIFEYDTGKFLKSLQPDKFTKCQQRCGRYISKDCCVTGGDDPNLFRLIDMKSYETLAYLSGLPHPVMSLDVGQDLRDIKSIVKKKRDVTGLPTIAFCCGTTLYQVDFTF